HAQRPNSRRAGRTGTVSANAETRPTASGPILSVRDLTKRFGGLVAVDGFELALPKGAIASLIWPNGAGKTTVFNMVAGIYRPTTGEIRFENDAIFSDGTSGSRKVWLRPDQVTSRGVARTFQNIRLF